MFTENHLIYKKILLCIYNKDMEKQMCVWLCRVIISHVDIYR